MDMVSNVIHDGFQLATETCYVKLDRNEKHELIIYEKSINTTGRVKINMVAGNPNFDNKSMSTS